jgi:hypothetical protein
MQQTTFASVAWEKKGKVTRRERFLAENSFLSLPAKTIVLRLRQLIAAG